MKNASIHRRPVLAIALVASVLVAALTLGACGSKSSSSSPTTTAAAAPSAANAPAPTNSLQNRRPIDPTNTPVTGQKYNVIGSFKEGLPVMDGNFADPFVLISGTTAYAYASNLANANIPVAQLDVDTQVGEFMGDALPNLPSWTSKGYVWAPSVYDRGDGTFVMYYNSVFGITGHQCLGRATSTNPVGPFVDDSSAPFVCPIDLGGAIDASMITVGGNPYLIYKSDGNCCQMKTTIWSQPLSSDLLSVEGSPSALISNDQGWEADVVEGPEMIDVNGQLWLFYSGNDWNTANYGIGYAKCATITGPCTKPSSVALVSATPDAVGTGGQTFIVQGIKAGMAYHGWTPGQVDTSTGERRLYTGTLDFSSGLPVLVAYSN